MAPGLPTHGHHVFVPPFGDATDVVIEGTEGHHLATVLRVRSGEALSLADDTGTVFQARVTDLGKRQVTVEVTDAFQMPSDLPRLTVVQSLPKGRKMEEIVQRLTEVGVDRLVPVHTARSIRQLKGEKADKVADRWAGIALAAAQQSRRARLMRIDPVSPWPLLGGTGVVLYEGAEVPLSVALADLPATDEIVLAVGPEGGFELREVEESGLAPAALGQTILRTETAGVVGAAIVLHHLGRLG